MGMCQYEFQFQNEYMRVIENEIGEILNICIDDDNTQIYSIDGKKFILRKNNYENIILFCSSRESYVYLVIIICEEKYEDKVRNVLLKISDEIEEDYGEDHRKEVRNVYLEEGNWLIRLNERYDIIRELNIKI